MFLRVSLKETTETTRMKQQVDESVLAGETEKNYTKASEDKTSPSAVDGNS